MTKISIDKIDSRLMEDFNKAEEPSTWIDKARPGTKGGEGKAPKAATYTKDTKYKPQEPGKPSGGKTVDTTDKPKDNFQKNAVPSYTKDTKYAAAHKTGTKDEPIPAMKGLEGDAGEEYGKHLPRFYQKTTAIQQNELLNGYLQGMGPKAPSFVTLKGKIVNGASEKDYAIKEGNGKLFSPNGPPAKLMTEGVFDGTVILSIGKSKRMVFEGAATAPLRKFIGNLVEIGQKVHIDVVGGYRKSYDDSVVYESLLRAMHAKRGGLDAIYKEYMTEAFKRFATLIKGEYNDFLYETRADWIATAVKPAFRQAARSFQGVYESMCKPYMVQVRAKTMAGNELFQVTTRSLSESHAAAHAIDKIMETTGPKTQIATINVDAKKYAPDKVKADTIMMPKFVTDGDAFSHANGAGSSRKATVGTEPKAPKAEEFKIGKAKLPAGTEEHKVSKKEGTTTVPKPDKG